VPDWGKYDGVWCCHTLEHMRAPIPMLWKMQAELAVGGTLAVTVPPLKEQIVGGHLSLWNAGMLLYAMVMAGIDCAQASVATYGYNVSVVTPKTGRAVDTSALEHDIGDIEKLREYFPLHVWQGFPGRIHRVNWK
jgi:hypothetical protein